MRTNHLYFFSTVAQVTGAIAGFSILGFIFGAERYGGYMRQEDRDNLLSGFLVLMLAIAAECVILFGDGTAAALAASRGLKTFGIPALVDAVYGDRIRYRLRRVPWPHIVFGVVIGFPIAAAAILTPILARGPGLFQLDFVLSVVAVGLGLTMILRALIELARPAEIETTLVWESWDHPRVHVGSAAPWRLSISIRNQSERPATNWMCRIHVPSAGYHCRLNAPLVENLGSGRIELDTRKMGTLVPFDGLWLMYLEPQGQSLPPGNVRWDIQGRDVRPNFEIASLHKLFDEQTGQTPP